MTIDWVPIGEPTTFDCKAKLEEISESLNSQT